MPLPYLEKLHKEKGIPRETLERHWGRAKQLAATQGHAEDFGYVTKIFQNLAQVQAQSSVNHPYLAKVIAANPDKQPNHLLGLWGQAKDAARASGLTPETHRKRFWPKTMEEFTRLYQATYGRDGKGK